jgi:hypothetical protein
VGEIVGFVAETHPFRIFHLFVVQFS